MHLDVMGYLTRWQVIGVIAKGIFYFFGYELQAGYDIENKTCHGHNEIAHAKDITQRQGQDIKEDEFLYKDRIREGNGCILDPFAGPTYIGKGLQLWIEDDELVAADTACAMEFHDPVHHHAGYLIGDMLLVIDLIGKGRVVVEQLDTGSIVAQVVPQRSGVGGDRIPEEAAILFIVSQYGRQLDSKIAAVIDKSAP